MCMHVELLLSNRRLVQNPTAVSSDLLTGHTTYVRLVGLVGSKSKVVVSSSSKEDPRTDIHATPVCVDTHCDVRMYVDRHLHAR